MFYSSSVSLTFILYIPQILLLHLLEVFTGINGLKTLQKSKM